MVPMLVEKLGICTHVSANILFGKFHCCNQRVKIKLDESFY